MRLRAAVVLVTGVCAACTLVTDFDRFMVGGAVLAGVDLSASADLGDGEQHIADLSDSPPPDFAGVDFAGTDLAGGVTTPSNGVACATFGGDVVVPADLGSAGLQVATSGAAGATVSFGTTSLSGQVQPSSDGSLNRAVFCVDSLTIPAGALVQATGGNSLVIIASRAITIAPGGELRLHGTGGSFGVNGGAPGAGGYAGGDSNPGGTQPGLRNGTPAGSGGGGGLDSVTAGAPSSGGSGGGGAGTSGAGGGYNASGGLGWAGLRLIGGAGGGGGSSDPQTSIMGSAASGGGGGGAVQLTALGILGNISVGGTIDAGGGGGGGAHDIITNISAASASGGGGGGAGGTVWLEASTVSLAGACVTVWGGGGGGGVYANVGGNTYMQGDDAARAGSCPFESRSMQGVQGGRMLASGVAQPGGTGANSGGGGGAGGSGTIVVHAKAPGSPIAYPQSAIHATVLP